MSTRHILLFGFIVALITAGCRKDSSVQKWVQPNFVLESDPIYPNLIWVKDTIFDRDISENINQMWTVEMPDSSFTRNDQSLPWFFIVNSSNELRVTYSVFNPTTYGQVTKSIHVDSIADHVSGMYDDFGQCFSFQDSTYLDPSGDTIIVDFPVVYSYPDSANTSSLSFRIPIGTTPGDYFWNVDSPGGPYILHDTTSMSFAFFRIYENSQSTLSGRVYIDIQDQQNGLIIINDLHFKVTK